MPRYIVNICYYASETIEVDANTPKEAAEMAYDEAQASLCHQCNSHIELGERYKAIVSDEDGNEIYDDEDPANG